jgi:hypothetical protein
MTVPTRDSWNDIEDGYESSGGVVTVLVQPEEFEESGAVRHRKVVEDAADGDVWAVAVTNSTHHWVAARFEGEPMAWDFAGLLTHLFSELGLMPAKATIQDTSISGKAKSLPTVVERGSDAESVLREAMGIKEHHLDRALE